MVPIFDDTGSHVLGFGGRVVSIESTNQEKQKHNTTKVQMIQSTKNYNQPKYLNSPESPVFQKKNILFGYDKVVEDRNNARLEQEMQRGKLASNKNKELHAPLLIVEGYMDAIALWQEGIRNVVASMGTALTKEQLLDAAKLSKLDRQTGTVVVCFDRDKAGVRAAERICNSGLLFALSSEVPAVRFKIATLPEKCKDPADYVEMKKSEHSANQMGTIIDVEDDFNFEVVEPAMEWMEWYMERLLSTYDDQALPNTPGSFGDVFEQIANFLSNIENPAERTKRSFQSAKVMAAFLSGSGSSAPAGATIQAQLESDLVQSASRLANQKNAIAKRLEASRAGTDDIDMQTKIRNLSTGSGFSGQDDSEKLSYKKLKEISPELVDSPKAKRVSSLARTQRQRTSPREVATTQPYSRQQQRQQQQRRPKRKTSSSAPNEGRRMFREKPKRKKQVNLPAGLENLSQQDLEWLGWDKGMPKIKNVFGEMVDPVYVTSEDYNGKSFLTDEGRKAGYKPQKVNFDKKLVLERGFTSVLEIDPDRISKAAEESVLYTLVNFAKSRTALKKTIDMNAASAYDHGVVWSSQDRAWLFDRLVNYADQIASNMTNPDSRSELHHLLASHADAPEGAFRVLLAPENEDDLQLPEPEQALAQPQPQAVQNALPESTSETMPMFDFMGDIAPEAEQVAVDTSVGNGFVNGMGAMKVNGAAAATSTQSSTTTPPFNAVNGDKKATFPMDLTSGTASNGRTPPSSLSPFDEDIDSWASSVDPAEMNDGGLDQQFPRSRNGSAANSGGPPTIPTGIIPNHQAQLVNDDDDDDNDDQLIDTIAVPDDDESDILSTVVSNENRADSILSDQDENNMGAGIEDAMNKLGARNRSGNLSRSTANQVLGSLDGFFIQSRDSFGALQREIEKDDDNSDLAIQESYCSLLEQSARKEAAAEKDILIAKEAEIRQVEAKIARDRDSMSKEELEKMKAWRDELETEGFAILERVQLANDVVNKLEASRQQVAKKLLEIVSSKRPGVGKMTLADVKELHDALDEHMDDIKNWSSRYDTDGDPYEDELERMAEEYGEYFNDDLNMWTPDPNAPTDVTAETRRLFQPSQWDN